MCSTGAYKGIMMMGLYSKEDLNLIGKLNTIYYFQIGMINDRKKKVITSLKKYDINQ